MSILSVSTILARYGDGIEIGWVMPKRSRPSMECAGSAYVSRLEFGICSLTIFHQDLGNLSGLFHDWLSSRFGHMLPDCRGEEPQLKLSHRWCLLTVWTSWCSGGSKGCWKEYVAKVGRYVVLDRRLRMVNISVNDRPWRWENRTSNNRQ